MSEDNTPNIPDAKKRMVSSMLNATGIALFMIGMGLVAFPEYGVSIFGEGEVTTTRIFGGALVIVGITDVFMAKFLFREGTK